MTETMGDTELTSGLGDPHQRFLSKYVAAARQAGVITNERLFARFPHERLFQAYKDEPKSRAALLCANSKMPFDYAVELDVSGCVQVFEIALNKLGEASADKVFGVVTPDELVRVMDAVELYRFVDETAWDETDTPAHRTLAAALLAAYKREELDGSLLKCLHGIEQAIGIDAIVKHLPIDDVTAIVRQARDLADKTPGNIAFTVDAMAEVATTDLLAKHLPLPVLMRVVRAKALEVGWVKPPKAATPPPPPPPPTTVAPSGDPDGDDDRVPTIPPPPKKPEAEDGDPEVSIGTAEAPPSEPPDPDDAALDDLLRDGGRKDEEEKPLQLDGVDGPEEDEKTTVGRVPVPAPAKTPPPLPGRGGGQQRRR